MTTERSSISETLTSAREVEFFWALPVKYGFREASGAVSDSTIWERTRNYFGVGSGRWSVLVHTNTDPAMSLVRITRFEYSLIQMFCTVNSIWRYWNIVLWTQSLKCSVFRQCFTDQTSAIAGWGMQMSISRALWEEKEAARKLRNVECNSLAGMVGVMARSRVERSFT